MKKWTKDDSLAAAVGIGTGLVCSVIADVLGAAEWLSTVVAGTTAAAAFTLWTSITEATRGEQ